MDLISRKSVAEKMARRRDYVGRASDPDCVIADEPSVPAVPLDKFYELCEETKARIPCAICEKIMPEWCTQHNKPTLTGRDWWDCPTWKQVLTKWMEEQDAAD